MLEETISRVRRNHGLEHATIHMLTARHKAFSAQGNSDHRGFSLNVYGDVSEEDVAAAVHEAHRRMKNGEHELAVHPNCGTALLTTGTLATMAAQAVFGIEQRRQGRRASIWSVTLASWPTAVLMVVLAIIVSRPLGLQLQERYTVSGDLGDLQVVQIRRKAPSLVTRFFHYLLAGGRQTYRPAAYRIETAG